MTMRSMLLAAVAAALVAAPAYAAPKPAGAKGEVANGVEARAKLGQVINDTLFSFAELGFQELETATYLTALLEKEGFKVERGTSGLPSGWVARWSNGSGGPVIAIGSDVDGIPKASQMPGVPWRKPMVEGGPGHGEGHNSGQAVNILAVLAVKDWMIRTKTPGTLVLWPGVAEELLGSKAWYVRDGLFKDVDVAMFTHVNSELKTFWGQPSGTGLVSVKYDFKGEAAHSAGLPWRGRSALDAAMLMGMGWDMRREHLRPQTRSHYIIPDGGDQPNVVPSTASTWFYFREMDFKRIKDLWAVGNDMADGAAKMTGTTVTSQILGSAAPGHFNKPLAEAMHANIEMVGLPKWDADDQAFAKAVQTMLGNDKVDGMPTKIAALAPPPDEKTRESGGSDDIGDVSWTVPTVELYYPSNIPGLPGHNWANAIAMATPIAHKGIVVGAKTMAMTLVDLFTKPQLITAAKAYFNDVQTKDQKYVPMLGATDKPPVATNRDVMAQFKAEQSKFYYQPEKYGTYLEQLGVTWPTLVKPADGAK
jgi:aminobenzoyl-glutamate utilization protein B